MCILLKVSNELNQNKCRLSVKKFCLAQNLKIKIWLFWPISGLKKALACWGSRYAPAKVASSSAFVCSIHTVCFALCFQKRHHSIT